MTPALVMFAIAFMATGNAAISGAAPSHSTRTATATHHRHDHSKQRPLCFGQPATIVAHNGQTVVRGTSGRDVIVDPNVFAVIRGRAGNDLICGGIAESEDDSPVGDIIHGGPGNDRIDGRIGPDALFGGPGNDTIFGRAGDDTIDGGSGDDTVYGGGGDDTFFSGSGSDKITGGHADGSTENTIAFLRATGPVTVDLATGTAIGSNLIDSFTSINDVIGSPYADTITGNRHDNQLRGDCGDDEISGGKGDDQLNGDLGDFDFYPSCSQPGQTDNDTLRGDAGDDTFALSPGSADGSDRAFGGSGNDRFTSLLGHDELDGGSGINVFSAQGSASGLHIDLTSGIYSWDSTGGSGTVRLIQNVIGADGDNVIVGDANDNVMSGGPGVDDIEGRGGADILSGLGGDDTLIAGNDPGDDADGGDGVDTCQATSTIACELSPTEAAGWRNSRSRGVAGG